jgi:signal transduction histidine kinase
LAVIISNLGYLGNVLSGASTDVGETITDTLASSDDLKHIIENLDLVAQTLAGALVQHPRMISLSALAHDLVNRSQQFAASHGVVLEDEPATEYSAQLRIESTPELVERVVSNLIRNAIAHSAERAKVLVQVAGDAGECTVLVSDSGSPFDAQHPERMFDARGQLTAKSEISGRYSRGVGLLAAKLAADACGARLLARPAEAPFKNTFELKFRRA